MHRYVTGTIALIAILAAAASGLAFSVAQDNAVSAPDVRWWRYGGTPTKAGYTLIKRVTVPQGHCLRIVHTNALAEKHSPASESGVPHTDAGEFTVMVGDIAQSSLETDNGIAYQGQGERNVTLLPGQTASIGIWLRPGKDPALYYYAVSMAGEMYRCRR
jgi:hypothetical protein